MHFQNQTLNRIVENYVENETIHDDDDWNDFMTLFGDESYVFEDEDYNKQLQEHKAKQRWRHLRLNWTHHVTQLLHEGFFKREYRMTYETWNRLYVVLSPKLQPKRYTPRIRDRQVTVQIIIGLGLRWLTGTDLSSCRHIFKVSRTEAYRCAKKFLNAVLQTRTLQIKLPKHRHQWEEVKKGFRRRSRKGVMIGCCGALDGIFIRTNSPKYSEVANVRSYYSGHYEHYGLNCQGMCDAYLRFMYFGIVSPGSTNDNISYTRTGELIDAIESLGIGEFVASDAAYTVTEHLWTPFTGPQRDNEKQDAFNFYLSQLRIRIEMAFGLLVNKFSILKKPLFTSLAIASKTIMCCVQLHNFVINNDGADVPDETNDNNENDIQHQQCVNGERLPHVVNSPGGSMVYQPTMIEDGFEEIIGISHSRRNMVDFLHENGFKRPEYNLIRNSKLRTMTKTQLRGSTDGYKKIDTDDEYFHPV